MGKRTIPEMAQSDSQASPVAGSSNLRQADTSGKPEKRTRGRPPRSSDEQQHRARSVDSGGSGNGDDASGVFGANGGTAEHGNAPEVLPSPSLRAMDMGRDEARSSSEVSDGLLAQVKESPIFTRRGLIRFSAVAAGPGIACEFGVFQGDSLREIKNWRKGEVFGFDSWIGLPSKWETGATDREHNKGHFACPMPKDLPHKTYLVPGWFKDTIPEWKQKHTDRLAFIHIDCDLYESTKDILNGLNDRISKGTIILFDEIIDFADDWYKNWREGEWKAFNEWLTEYVREVKPIGRTEHQQAAFMVEN